MSNYYSDYYDQQAQTGQTSHNRSSGRNQRGLGFKSFVSGLLPFIKKAGKTLLNTGVGIGGDLFEGKNVIDSLKTRGITAAEDIAEEACDELRSRKAQKGSGLRRRKKATRKTRKCKTPKCLKRKSTRLSSSLLRLLSSKKVQKKRRVVKRKPRK